MSKFNFIAQREFEQNLCVVISAETSDGIKTVIDLLLAVRNSITQWAMDVVQENDKAVSVLEYAGIDLNIMDIEPYLDDPHLMNCLKINGVQSLTINSYDENNCWTIDTRLLDEDRFGKFMAESKDIIASSVLKKVWS